MTSRRKIRLKRGGPRYRKLPRLSPNEQHALDMLVAQTPLPSDSYAKTHTPPTDAQIEAKRQELRRILGRS